MAPSDTRDRSRSPKRSKKSSGGLKWKEKPRKTDADTNDRSSSTKTYRERSPKYDSKPRDRERDRDRDDHDRRHRDRRDRSGDRERPHRSDRPKSDRHEAVAAQHAPPAAEEASSPAFDPTSVAAKFGAKAAARAAAAKKTPQPGGTQNGSGTAADKGAEEAEDTAIKTTAAPKYALGGTGEQMIIVHVNDRLGTKAAIPCMPSDPIKAFKAMVAARIGRRPHEIMIKRQGERPFKDQLTLEDYGVGNGVQLDLELDTGD